MGGSFEKDRMATCEYFIFERHEDDWFISDDALDRLAEKEYGMYLEECSEENTIYAEQKEDVLE